MFAAMMTAYVRIGRDLLKDLSSIAVSVYNLLQSTELSHTVGSNKCKGVHENPIASKSRYYRYVCAFLIRCKMATNANAAYGKPYAVPQDPKTRESLLSLRVHFLALDCSSE
jgi:hypothetical protein